MAHIEKRNEKYRIVFRLDGKRFSRSLDTTSESAANLALAKVKDGLHRFNIGLLEFDPNDDVVSVLLSSGSRRHTPTVRKSTTIGRLLDDYHTAIPAGSIEDSSLGMLRTHIVNLKRHLGVRLLASNVNLSTLQGYINSRCKDKGIRGENVSPVTIRKEITTFYAAWSWANDSSMVSTTLPRKARLRYPKRKQKPPFMTWYEIERIIERGKLSEAKQRDFWDCLYLSETQVVELLADVAKTDAPACMQAMMTAAAYTGARRSELLRSRLEDVDLESGKFTIREKKRIRSQHSTRSVSVCKALHKVLLDWFDNHPGGPFTFSFDSTAITRDQSHDYFTRTLKATKWKVLRGWHCLRHSFISNCASKNIDQRIIDDWVGHQTDAMRCRYRHLFPNVQRSAIETVFGGVIAGNAATLPET